MNERLNAEQIRQYIEDGYTLFKNPVFSPDQFRRLTAIFEEHLAQKGDKLSDELNTPHFHDERLLEFLLAPEVLDLVEPLIGGDIGLWASHFISKAPHTGRATPWHEDSAYWKGRMDAFDGIVTVWLAIDSSDRENGCLRVIPGTHSDDFSEYKEVDTGSNTFATGIQDINESDAVDFELLPGECSLHDARIIHGATANTSNRRRCGYTMRYFSTRRKVNPAMNPPGFKIWLARGRDLAGNEYVNA